MASTRKSAKPKSSKSDMRSALKRRLAMKYVKGQRSGGRRATRAAIGVDD